MIRRMVEKQISHAEVARRKSRAGLKPLYLCVTETAEQGGLSCGEIHLCDVPDS